MFVMDAGILLTPKLFISIDTFLIGVLLIVCGKEVMSRGIVANFAKIALNE
jgi:hypothetical protein